MKNFLESEKISRQKHNVDSGGHLFIFPNFFSIISAEQIIKQNGIKNAFALIMTRGNADYIKKCISNMDKNLWKDIEVSPYLFRIKFNTFSYSRKAKRYFLEEETYINEILKKHDIKKMYLSNLENINQKIAFAVAKEKCKEVNLCEEGIALYYSSHENTRLNYIKNKMKDFFYGEKYRYLLKNKTDFEIENLYSFLPHKYDFPNVKNKIELKFILNSENKEKIRKLEIENLFLSRPVSEDNKMPLNCELNILDRFLSSNNFKNIYFKFHPREQKTKIELLKRKFNIKLLPEEYQNIPAEEIVWFSNVRNLIGYDTSTLAYMSELKNSIKVYSLLGEIVKNSSPFRLKQVYKLYKEKFQNINFIKF